MPIVTQKPKIRPVQQLPVIVEMLRDAEAIPGAWFAIAVLKQVLTMPITPATNRQYQQAFSELVRALGLIDPHPFSRKLESACFRQPEHDDGYWYDASGAVRCMQCLTPRTGKPGLVRPLDLDACPRCLGDRRVFVGGGGSGYGPCPDCEAK